MAELQLVQNQLQELAGIVQNLQNENENLKAQLRANTTEMLGFQKRQAEAMEKMAARSNQTPSLIDQKGIGRPDKYNGKDFDAFLPWSVKTSGFISGVYSEFKEALVWAQEFEKEIEDDDIGKAYGMEADDVDRIEDLQQKEQQLYTALLALTEDDAWDIVHNAGDGRGFEAWRRLHARYDPLTSGRKRNLLNAILRPTQCKKWEELARGIEQWTGLVGRYERRKDESGKRLHIAEDIRGAAFEALLPDHLQEHFERNRTTYNSFAKVRMEVESFIESKTGKKVKVDPFASQQRY